MNLFNEFNEFLDDMSKHNNNNDDDNMHCNANDEIAIKTYTKGKGQHIIQNQVHPHAGSLNRSIYFTKFKKKIILLVSAPYVEFSNLYESKTIDHQTKFVASCERH